MVVSPQWMTWFRGALGETALHGTTLTVVSDSLVSTSASHRTRSQQDM
ncbi:hypothetical protein LINPERHAP1_LOCUS5874 [Linum perenne]